MLRFQQRLLNFLCIELLHQYYQGTLAKICDNLLTMTCCDDTFTARVFHLIAGASDSRARTSSSQGFRWCWCPAPRGQERLKEAAKLGFTHALIPESNKPRQVIPGLEVIAVRRIEEAVEQLRSLG
jgi:hypothetical protein